MNVRTHCVVSVPISAAPSRAHTLATPQAPVDSVDVGHHYESVPGLGHIEIRTVDPREVATDDGRQRVANEMAAELKAWPSVTSVVGVLPKSASETSVLVASRPDAVEAEVMQGVYEINQRLCGSQFVKDMASKYPSSYQAVQNFDPEAKTQQIRLPGPFSVETVEHALAEGRTPNQYGMLKEWVDSMPAGRSVILGGGPSAAGKSGIISKVTEQANGRPVTAMNGDMFFKDVDQPGNPTTSQGTPYFDHQDFMDFDCMNEKIGELVNKGSSDLPIYNFQDVRPGGWHIPDVKSTGFREDKVNHVEMDPDGILFLDSLHATNPKIVDKLEELNLPYRGLYLDSESSSDRLGRKIVRDYAERGGRSAEDTMAGWDLTTWRGEKEFIREGLLRLDPARDLTMILKFPKDLGLSREQLETRAAALKEFGLAPTYEAFQCAPDQLGTFAKGEEKRLSELLAGTPDDKTKARAERELLALRQAPNYQAA